MLLWWQNGHGPCCGLPERGCSQQQCHSREMLPIALNSCQCSLREQELKAFLVSMKPAVHLLAKTKTIKQNQGFFSNLLQMSNVYPNIYSSRQFCKATTIVLA